VTIFRVTRIDSQQRAEVVVYLADVLDATKALNTVVQGAQSAFAELTHTEADARLATWCAASARQVCEYASGIIRWHVSTSPPLPLVHLRTRVDEYYRSVEDAYSAVGAAFEGAEHESDTNVHIANYRLFVERYRNYSAAGQRANAEFRKAMQRFRISEAEVLPQEDAAKKPSAL
jgi:hypothetical protein